MAFYDPYFPVPKSKLNQYDSMELTDFYKNPENVGIRKAAINFMLVAQHQIRDVFALYMAVTLFDRFFPKNGILAMEATYTAEIELLALSCLSLASKMRSKTKAPVQIVYPNRRKLEKAESIITEALGLKSLTIITPFAFAPHQYQLCLSEELPINVSIVLLETQDDVRFLDFKPSVVSAAAVLTAIGDLHPHFVPLFPDFVSSFDGIDTLSLKRCFTEIHQMCKTKTLLFPHPSFIGGPWDLEPTKGPPLQVSLKWNFGVDIAEVLQAFYRVVSLGARLSLITRRINFLQDQMDHEEQAVEIKNLEHKRNDILVRILLLRN